MSGQDSYNGFSLDADKCPNCGAVKVYSALVCPACGMSYSDSAAIKKSNGSKPDKFSRISKNSEMADPEIEIKPAFDPNASFSKFKESLNEDGEKKTESDKKSGEDPDGEMQVIQEETGTGNEKQAEEQKQRPENDPVNSGLYGEHRYRVGEDVSTPLKMSEKRPDPVPDQTIVPTRYGLDSEVVRQKREQSHSDDAAKQKMFSNSVSQRYEKYKTNSENSYDQPTYSTPYNRGNYDVTPESKTNIWAKIIPLVAVLALLAVAGYFIFQLF